MEPLSALSLACNIIDLVGVAVKSVVAFTEIYGSVDGLRKAHEIIDAESTRLKDVIDHLTTWQTELEQSAADAQIQGTASRILTQCEALRKVFDECRPKKGS